MIVIALVCLGIGILVGMNIRQETLEHRYLKTVEEVDAQIRKDLELNKNLVASLRNDVKWLNQQLDYERKKNIK